MLETHETPLLAKALTANAWFSRISGLLFAVLSPWLADFAGIDTWVVLVAGLGLVGYSLWLGAAAARIPTNRIEAWTAIVGDDLWVIGAALIIFMTDWITTEAKVALGAISLVVMGFGVAQLIGLVQQENATPAGPATTL